MRERLLAPLRLHMVTLVAFIAADTAFSLVFLFGDLGGAFRLGNDHGWPERFNFVKWGLIAILCVVLYARLRTVLFLALGAASLILLSDDSLQIHERMAGVLLDVTGLRRFDLPADHMLAEVVVFALLGLSCVSLVVLALRLDGPKRHAPAIRILFDIARIVGLIAVFGIGVDILHGVVPYRIPGTELPLLVLEEAGEMFGISVLLAYFAGLVPLQADADHPLP